MKIQGNHDFLLCFLFLLSFRTHLTVFAADRISSGESLTGNQTIISRGGNFELGFFKPGKSQNNYIGIWYKKLSGQSQTVVWVANRDKPVFDLSNSKLTLLGNGNLVITNQTEKSPPIWSTNSKNATEAVLGDDGNLVLRDGSNLVIWQSFDYPTDTWLPGGRIGFNKNTKKTWLLTSWRNREDPAPGIFTLELDPNGKRQTLIRWNKSVQVWTTGEWNKSYPSVPPKMTGNSIMNESFISNVNESYLTYTLLDSWNLMRIVMDVSGQIKQYTWTDTMKKDNLFWSLPEQLCDVYGICGPFGNCNQDTMNCECLPGFVERSPSDWNLQDSTGGCVRNISLQCGKKDGFSPMSTSNLPDNPVIPQVNSGEECKAACESTCTCNAYAYRDSECQLWDGDMLNVIQQSDGKAGNLYLKRSASEIRNSAPIAQVRKRNAIIWKVIVPVSILVASLMGVLGYIYLFKRNKANERGKLKRLQGVLPDFLKTKASYNNVTLDTNLFNDGKTEEETRELQIFNPACLAIATNNFSLTNKLGEGGFGPVYKGKLQNGQEIAVKRLSQSSGQGIEEFKNEIILISKLQHRNLVKLLGCCIEGDAKMLIYEYMPNKSLDAFLFDPRKKTRLDWDTRFNIVGGIARGLLYLHRDSRLRVIHRDLKVSNILLDEDMNPKISDFGMARIFGGKQTIANTTRVVGTFGYMSPEYVTKGTFSEKSDVFSFGVLMLEILSSKRNNSFYDPEGPLNLLLHAWSLWNEGRWPVIVDEALGDAYRPSEVMKCIHIALLCVQNRTVDRPSMAEVDLMLGSETDRPFPKEPPFTTHPTSSVQISNNNVSFTKLEGR